MVSVTCVLVYLLATPVEGPDPARLKARAALALAFADAKPPTYDEGYAAAVRGKKPLVVWVGRPGRHLGGCVCVTCDTFPGVAGSAVVVGVPDRGVMRRIDLPGSASDETIRAAIREVGGETALPPRR